jgi:hypothetical protein
MAYSRWAAFGGGPQDEPRKQEAVGFSPSFQDSPPVNQMQESAGMAPSYGGRMSNQPEFSAPSQSFDQMEPSTGGGFWGQVQSAPRVNVPGQRQNIFRPPPQEQDSGMDEPMQDMRMRVPAQGGGFNPNSRTPDMSRFQGVPANAGYGNVGGGAMSQPNRGPQPIWNQRPQQQQAQPQQPPQRQQSYTQSRGNQWPQQFRGRGRQQNRNFGGNW